MGVWLEEHVRELEEHLRLEQIRLARLREMQRYWRTLGCGTGKATFTDQLANYEIWSFDLSRELTRLMTTCSTPSSAWASSNATARHAPIPRRHAPYITEAETC